MEKKDFVKTTEIGGKSRTGFIKPLSVLLIQLLFVQWNVYPASDSKDKHPTERIDPAITINSKELRDYVCVVNRYLHPNIELYLNVLIKGFMGRGDSSSDDYARKLEYIKRGGFGSGFVYVDNKGNNYILTNYHVIVGAYRLSVTFENGEGDKITFLNLSVFNVDVEADLAILAFPDGWKPFKKGIPIVTGSIKDASAVRAAGYPGIPDVPRWNNSDGSVVNPRIKLPGMEDWYVQHSAPINPGNSGGPLLIPDRKSFLGYSVVGINSFYIQEKQGANFAIPSEKVMSFMKASFEQVNERAALEKRVTDFMVLLNKSSDSNFIGYKPISTYLSNTMINADPIKTVRDLPDNIKGIMEKVLDDPVVGIGWAVAYNQIEGHVYRKHKNARTELISITPNNRGGYTGKLLINGYPYRTEWIKDYGTWKLDDFAEDDGEYNDSYDLATQHPLGKKVIYSFSSGLDYDWYVLDIQKQGKLTVWTEGNTDTLLILCYDPATEASMERTLIGAHDDISGTNKNARVEADVRAGTVYVFVKLSGGRIGEYTLCAELK
ncbi:MAG: S1C family serine protease [Spirochaetaceae bacterium]|nr:S1C family serine protease [Spirochaetaceae bacterium]